MNPFQLSLLVLALTGLTACGGNRTCEEAEFYEASQLGDPVAVPDDLDNLEPTKELKIPEPSGRPPRPADAGCIDKPPKIGTS